MLSKDLKCSKSKSYRVLIFISVNDFTILVTMSQKLKVNLKSI